MKKYLLTTPTVLLLAGGLFVTGLAMAAGPASAQTQPTDEPEASEEMESEGTDEMGRPGQKRRDRAQRRMRDGGDRYQQRRMRYHRGDRDDMMGGMMGRGMGHGQMMRMMFIVADADGDGALSLQEIQTVHERIFNAVDADDDGRVTLEEMREFMSDARGPRRGRQ